MTRESARALVEQTLQLVAKAMSEDVDLETLEPQFDALVDAAAAPDEAPSTILKFNDEEHMVYGWASVATEHGQPISDRQGDSITVPELREAVYDFMRSRVGKSMHAGRQTHTVVDSFVIDNAVKKALGMSTPYEGWFVGAKVDDPRTWERVRSGELAAFSIGGTGVREPVK